MLNHLVPRLKVQTIYDIPLQQLWEAGIRGIITDLDNTLVGAKDPHATPELIKWLEQVRAIGFKIVIVSNNHHSRVSRFSEPLGIPFLYKAKKPLLVSFRRALELLQLRSGQAAVVGDQMMTDVLGGNRLGLYTVLVQPIAPLDEGKMTKWVNRRLERLALKLMKGRNTDARR